MDALPIAEGSGIYHGMVGRCDLVRELLRPLALPQIGGMATPMGVHLSTGTVSAGVGHPALVLTGFCFFFIQLSLVLLLTALEPYLPTLPLPPVWRETIELALATLFSLGGFLALIRLSPLSGFHAAEHQVVHALERHVPLLPERVGLLPRVHPRCGTNLMAASFLLGLGGVLSPLLGQWSYMLSGLLALLFWRSLGAWLQENLTTRPATHAQLTQAISAAQSLLERHEARPLPATPGEASVEQRTASDASRLCTGAGLSCPAWAPDPLTGGDPASALAVPFCPNQRRLRIGSSKP